MLTVNENTGDIVGPIHEWNIQHFTAWIRDSFQLPIIYGEITSYRTSTPIPHVQVGDTARHFQNRREAWTYLSGITTMCEYYQQHPEQVRPVTTTPDGVVPQE